jgi:hypothetical protein
MLAFYLPGILTLVGITNTQQQLGINLGLTVASYLSTVVGAMIVDRVARRFLLITTMAVFTAFLCLLSLTGGLFANGIAQSAVGIVTIVLIYLFQISNGVLCKSMFPRHSSASLQAIVLIRLGQRRHCTIFTPRKYSIIAKGLKAWECTLSFKIALDLQ